MPDRDLIDQIRSFSQSIGELSNVSDGLHQEDSTTDRQRRCYR